MPKGAKIGELTNSRTQVLDYLNCGYRWDLGYRRGIASTKVREAMDLGSAVHMGVRFAVHHYASQRKWKKQPVFESSVLAGVDYWAAEERERRGAYLTDEMRDEIEAIRLDAFNIALKGLEYIDLPSLEIMYIGGEPVCEQEFMVPLPPWKGYRTIPDLIARPWGSKAWWLIDWKCRSSFDEDDAEEINLQFATMQYVMEHQVSDKIAGSILWQIKAQAPRKPDRNKDGKMSRAAIVTDWKTYEAALREAKLNPADYEDMKEKLAQVEWFRALKQHRSSKECKAVWDQIVVPAATRMAKDPQIIRRWTFQPFACRGCWAKDFCMAELRGEDTEFLLETDYMDTRAPRVPREIGDKRKTFTLK